MVEYGFIIKMGKIEREVVGWGGDVECDRIMGYLGVDIEYVFEVLRWCLRERVYGFVLD